MWRNPREGPFSRNCKEDSGRVYDPSYYDSVICGAPRGKEKSGWARLDLSEFRENIARSQGPETLK